MIKEIRNKNYKIVISQDLNADSPRVWDNLGTIVAFHKEYDLSDNNDLKSSDFGNWQELQDYLRTEKKAKIILPLYAYIHSGITLRIGSFEGSLPEGHARFDSGKIGYIYVTEEKLIKELGEVSEKTRTHAIQILEAEIKAYNQYLNGDVYDVIIYKETPCECCKKVSEESIDSCGNFFSVEEAEEWANEMISDKKETTSDIKQTSKIEDIKQVIKEYNEDENMETYIALEKIIKIVGD